jgi:PRTRC genetic system ThiF family protein
MISLEKIFPLYTNYRFHFIVLGCGGTGSAFIPRLCALLSTLELSHRVSIFDADHVEPKNLTRQNFFKQDLNKNKAEVLAAKCNTMFNVNVTAYNRYVETKEDLASICGIARSSIPVIVGCVDTNAVRKMIHEFMQDYGRNVFWLDSGNEEFVGQVVLSHSYRYGDNGPQKSLSTSNTYGYQESYKFYLPDVTHFFPDMLESKEQFASEVSCAEHAISHPQAAITNATAATLLLQFCAAMLDGSISFHKVTFDAQRCSYNTVFNYESVLRSYGNTIAAKFTGLKPDPIKPQKAAQVETHDFIGEILADMRTQEARQPEETPQTPTEDTPQDAENPPTDLFLNADDITTL